MIDFPRYLSAKKSVDDRALNRQVWGQLFTSLSHFDRENPCRILEVGCGIGTMVERLLGWGFDLDAEYIGVDAVEENILNAVNRLELWGRDQGFTVKRSEYELELHAGRQHFLAKFTVRDAHQYLLNVQDNQFDLVIAQAFLDLVNVPQYLPLIRKVLKPAGLYYFSINFDGVTVFEPSIDPHLESQIIQLYHQTMDDRIVGDQQSGDSLTGRHLFSYLKSAGGHIHAVGASDWVVYPGKTGYPADEAYFLKCILQFFETALQDHLQLDPAEFSKWLAERRKQVDHGELIFIAHQLDFLGNFAKS